MKTKMKTKKETKARRDRNYNLWSDFAGGMLDLHLNFLGSMLKLGGIILALVIITTILDAIFHFIP